MKLKGAFRITVQPATTTENVIVDGNVYHRNVPAFEAELDYDGSKFAVYRTASAEQALKDLLRAIDFKV